MLIQWNYVWDSSLRPQIQKKERCCRLAHFFSKNAPQFCHLGDPGVPTRCGWLGVGWPHPHSLWTQPFPVKRAYKINHKVLQWSTGSRQVHALTHSVLFLNPDFFARLRARSLFCGWHYVEGFLCLLVFRRLFDIGCISDYLFLGLATGCWSTPKLICLPYRVCW